MIAKWNSFLISEGLSSKEIAKSFSHMIFTESQQYEEFIKNSFIDEDDIQVYFTDILDIGFSWSSEFDIIDDSHMIFNDFGTNKQAFTSYNIILRKAFGKVAENSKYYPTFDNYKSWIEDISSMNEDMDISLARVKDNLKLSLEHVFIGDAPTYDTSRSGLPAGKLEYRICFRGDEVTKELDRYYKEFIEKDNWLVSGMEEIVDVFNSNNANSRAFDYGYGKIENIQKFIDLHPDWDDHHTRDVVIGFKVEDDIIAIGSINKDNGKANIFEKGIKDVLKDYE